MIYCQSCGTQNDGISKFCSNCGTTLEVAAKPEQQQQQQQPVQQQQPPQSPAQQQNLGQPAYQQPIINVNITQDQSQQQQQQQQAHQPPRIIRVGGRKDPTTALLIAIFFPGFGYAYIGQMGKAIGYFLIIIFTYFILIGFFIHIYTIIDSYNETKRINNSMGYIV